MFLIVTTLDKTLWFDFDFRPLIIFDFNDHCVKNIQVLTNRGHLGSNKIKNNFLNIVFMRKSYITLFIIVHFDFFSLYYLSFIWFRQTVRATLLDVHQYMTSWFRYVHMYLDTGTGGSDIGLDYKYE